MAFPDTIQGAIRGAGFGARARGTAHAEGRERRGPGLRSGASGGDPSRRAGCRHGSRHISPTPPRWNSLSRGRARGFSSSTTRLPATRSTTSSWRSSGASCTPRSRSATQRPWPSPPTSSLRITGRRRASRAGRSTISTGRLPSPRRRRTHGRQPICWHARSGSMQRSTSRIHPTWWPGWHRRAGEALFEFGDPRQAIAHFRAALAQLDRPLPEGVMLAPRLLAEFLAHATPAHGRRHPGRQARATSDGGRGAGPAVISDLRAATAFPGKLLYLPVADAGEAGGR